jgi:hypothetical protein
MLVYLNNIPFQVLLLAKAGWLQQALELNEMGFGNQLLDAPTHEALRQAVAQSKPFTPSRQHEIFGIAYDSVISTLQLTEVQTIEEMKEAFRQGVRLVEIETSSQCNRQCSYCPNSTFDRMSANQFLDMEVYEKVLSDLAEIHYDGLLNLVGNNEFFMHMENFDYLRKAREKLPLAQLHLFSNGDYLTRDMLEQAERLGVTLMHVTFHPGKGKPYDAAEVLSRAWKFASKNNLALQIAGFEEGRELRAYSKLGNLNILSGGFNHDVTGHNWAECMPQLNKGQVRTAPCTYPARQFVLNYEADMFMCCIAFKQKTEAAIASGAWTGNVTDFPSIFHAYASQPMLDWRRGVFHGAAKTGPCAECIGHQNQNEEIFRELANQVAGRLELGPALQAAE